MLHRVAILCLLALFATTGGLFAQEEQSQSSLEKDTPILRAAQKKLINLDPSTLTVDPGVTITPLQEDELALVVSTNTQTLYVIKGNDVLASFPVMTADCFDNTPGSNCTPLGTHRVKFRTISIIDGRVFKARRPSGEVQTIFAEAPEEDVNIQAVLKRSVGGLTGILQLRGAEEGNFHGEIQRFTYITATAFTTFVDEVRAGDRESISRGAILMKNQDFRSLYETIQKHRVFASNGQKQLLVEIVRVEIVR